MNSPIDPMNQLEELLVALTERELSAAQRKQLRDILRQSPEARRYYRRYLEVHVLLEWEAGASASTRVLANPDDQADLALYASLDDLHNSAELVHLNSPLRNAGWWHLRRGHKTTERTTSGPMLIAIPKPVLYSGIAAMLLLAASLLVILGNLWTGPDNLASSGRVAPDPAATPSQPPAQSAVATLTAEHGAQWQAASGTVLPGVGDQLHAGQRLTLTEGSAQITTARGAIAILQAPCSVELLDQDNALRLIRGKLVGICETQSSKGFVVHTPQLDITDLGTRFGVEVTPGSATEVHVHQGMVLAASTRPAGVTPNLPLVVKQNQAIRAPADADVLAMIRPAYEKFDDRLSTFRLFSTGFDLAEGMRDLGWQIVADAKGPLDQPIPLIVQHGARPDNHFQAKGNDPGKAQWLTYAPGYALYDEPRRPDLDRSVLTIQCRVVLPKSVSLDNADFVLQYASSYGVTELRINGTPVQAVPKETNADRRPQPYREIQLAAHTTALRHGENIIEIDVPKLALATQAPLSIYFYAAIRPPADPSLETPGETRP